MKKSIVILLLAALQAACGQQPTHAPASSVLLTFEQIGSEISVDYEQGDEAETPAMTGAL